MTRLLLLNKPHGVICQFSGEGRTLAGLVDVPEVYPAGRLDKDSEGLVVLTDDGGLQTRISNPSSKMPKRYLVQVEGEPTAATLTELLHGVTLKDGPARAMAAALIDPPAWLWPRDPPVRVRRSIPTAWIEMVLTEGRNRQVRRMTAAIGHPTLRLIRGAVGPWDLAGLACGEWREADPSLAE